MTIIRRKNRLESCSSPQKLVKTCSLDCKKQILAWDLVFFVDIYIMFMHICLHLDDDVISWESNISSDFVAQIFFGI